MANLTAGAILAKAAKILQDETGIRWPVTGEMIGWLDSGQREIAMYKPSALAITESVLMAAGSKQNLPAGAGGTAGTKKGTLLLSVNRNMGTNGTTPGRALTEINRQILDRMIPDWHLMTGAAAESKHYCYDPKNPKIFWLYPPQPASNMNQLELTYAYTPTALVDANSTVEFDDIYEGVLIDYVLYRAYAKDSEHTFNAQLAQYYRNSFLSALGARGQIEQAATATMQPLMGSRDGSAQPTAE